MDDICLGIYEIENQIIREKTSLSRIQTGFKDLDDKKTKIESDEE